MADEDEDEVHASPISAQGAEEGMILLGLLCALVAKAEVPAKADLKKDEGAVFAVEGVVV